MLVPCDLLAGDIFGQSFHIAPLPTVGARVARPALRLSPSLFLSSARAALFVAPCAQSIFLPAPFTSLRRQER